MIDGEVTKEQIDASKPTGKKDSDKVVNPKVKRRVILVPLLGRELVPVRGRGVAIGKLRLTAPALLPTSGPQEPKLGLISSIFEPTITICNKISSC